MQTREELRFLKEKRTGKRSEANLVIISLIKKISRTWGQLHIWSMLFTEESVKESPWEQKQNQKIKEIRNASAIQRNSKLRMKTNREVQKGKNVDKGIACW